MMPICNTWLFWTVWWNLIGVFPTLAVYKRSSLDEKAMAILDTTAAYYQTLENFSATYNLTICYGEAEETESFKMVITASGQQHRLCYGQKEIVTDGETVWTYDSTFHEVTLTSYDQTDDSVNFAELYNLYQKGYRAIYMGADGQTTNSIYDIVQLISVDEENLLQSITLEIDRATLQIHGWEMVQHDEIRYICTGCSFSVNLPLPDDYFTFDLNAYKEVEVIDLREEMKEVE